MRPARGGNRSGEYSYFVSFQTYGRRSLFQVEKYAGLMVDVLKHYDGNGYKLHGYVVMPDHVHVLLTPSEAIEKSVQLIKGGFSFRMKREHGMNGEVWQPGFTDHRIRDSEDWERHLNYIRLNPVEARLVEDSVLYEWMGAPSIAFPQGLKPRIDESAHVRAEARTLRTSEHSDGAAKAAPFQNKGRGPQVDEIVDVRAEARTLHTREHPNGAAKAAPFSRRTAALSEQRQVSDNAPPSLK